MSLQILHINKKNSEWLFWGSQLLVWTLFFIYKIQIEYRALLQNYTEIDRAMAIGTIYLFVYSYTGLLLSSSIRCFYKRIISKASNIGKYFSLLFFQSFILANIWFLEVIMLDKVISSMGFQVTDITLRYYLWELVQGTLVFISWSLIYSTIEQNITKMENETQLANTTLMAERAQLQLLKYQLNPHFLFNILNSIHSFAQRDIHKTSYVIMKLSEMMRYMIYEASEDNVLLQKEIAYIKSFIELHKVRFSHTNFVDFEVEGEVSQVLLPPLLFIPFIENAFKYGSKKEGDKIIIGINVSNTILNFKCVNKKRLLSETELKNQGGVGIVNAQQRLNLLLGKKHELSIQESDNEYIVNLKIDLK